MVYLREIWKERVMNLFLVLYREIVWGLKILWASEWFFRVFFVEILNLSFMEFFHIELSSVVKKPVSGVFPIMLTNLPLFMTPLTVYLLRK